MKLLSTEKGALVTLPEYQYKEKEMGFQLRLGEKRLSTAATKEVDQAEVKRIKIAHLELTAARPPPSGHAAMPLSLTRTRGEVARSQPKGAKPSREDRKDLPILRPSRRACKQVALSAAVDEQSKQEALKLFEKDIDAASSSASMTSWWRTWLEFHHAWHGPEVEALPLTPSKIEAVLSMMKAGGYRGVANYLGLAKDKHVQSGEPWTLQLARASRKGARSVLRGIGPARQAGYICPAEVAKMEDVVEPMVQGGPLSARRLFVVASLFLLREIEVAALRIKHVTFNTDVLEVTLKLVASKSDTEGATCSRTWGCTCDNTEPRRPCAYHALESQIKELRGRFGEDHEIRVFPNEWGQVVSKELVVRTYEALATSLKLPLTDEEGNRQFSGHSSRVSGAQYLAGLGV
jgi:hypothetical protein